ncbi:MAG: hypothetical protein WAK78_04940, partial [Candidatus Acidiferrales bacterium]
LDINLVDRLQITAKLRQYFEHHVIGIVGEILRDLALAEGVVERVVDELRLDAEARRRWKSVRGWPARARRLKCRS